MDSSSSDESTLDSEVEVFPFHGGENISDDEHHGAWGSQKNLFYDGNYLSEDSGSDGANNLEQEEIDLTEKKLSGILREADYEPYWPEINKLAESSNVGIVSTNKIPAVQKIISSLQGCNKLLQEYIWYSGIQESLLTPDGNACIQMKMHLMFCYSMSVLYFLQLKEDRSHHPVVEKMMLLNELISKVGKGDDQLHRPIGLCNTKGSRQKERDLCIDEVSLKLLRAPTSTLQHYKQQEEKTVHTSSQLSVLQELDGKRAITYQIARNKGLMPKRKKEQRNPRVKHRRKYSKALIKRRSQVLPVVHEQYKYGGETSGIRSQLARSVIIK